MSSSRLSATRTDEMREQFGERLRESVNLAPYTSARIGGMVDYLLIAKSAKELEEMAQQLWNMDMNFRILGGGSNVLVSDRGVRGVVILNQARKVAFDETSAGPRVRRSVDRDWLGLEWAATIPGTVGGAVVGNAGAHGGDIASSLEVAEILQQNRKPESWRVERLNYGYRDSVLKNVPGSVVVLEAAFRLKTAQESLAKAKLAEFAAYRQRTQPGGASWGSMFKNPAEKYAGRLIDTAGLKGLQIGGARVSTKHANFFLNLGDASAADVLRLLKTVRDRVDKQFNVELELEIELFGDWDPDEIEGVARQIDGNA